MQILKNKVLPVGIALELLSVAFVLIYVLQRIPWFDVLATFIAGSIAQRAFARYRSDRGRQV
jgi:hypothetical protein